ncbi:MAG: cytochrome c maturation protein CcmE [Acidimicrobiia bacterium]|nr:cytochrome c maturation protein CcmE [Acidimicrobiia bacterium]MYC58403.1 cytochrome c maturation protein CcmE [Acidimicrobiia bacterium]MYG94162.1 cytochrome c maturation protein CcmE [Acidimicrobiia bacterium]MYI30491.1 cytochrome c maturation protein CcmE [Acidimicrobiia bacterium]
MSEVAENLDLTPRPARPARAGLRRWGSVFVVFVVLLVIGIVLWRALADATLVFREVDDAVEHRLELGDDRFRMIGSPVSGSIQEVSLLDGRPAVAFSLVLDGVVADVVHTGGVSDQFQPEVPVVIDGHWENSSAFANLANDGWYFASDRMLVKHDNEYRVDNQDRIEQVEERGQYQ